MSHIRDCDGIFQVVRVFEDAEIVHTENEIDPIRDLKIISDELILKDLDFLSKRMEEVEQKAAKHATEKDIKEEKDILDRVRKNYPFYTNK